MMRPEQIKSEVDKLALQEKLELVGDIWDSIAAEHAQMPLPEWQKRELDRRYKEYKAGKLKLYDWESIYTALRDSAR